eukprot:g14113.t1
MDSSDQGEDSFLVELLNAKRLGEGTMQSRHFMATPPDVGPTTKDEFPGWDDGGEYARAAEAAGLDVGGMLEAGADAKQLLEFVSNFRRQEGAKLGLLDEQNLKFATSQVLREGPRAGADVVRTQFAGDGRSSGAPAAGTSAWGISAEGKGKRREARETPSRVATRQPLQPRNGTSPNPDRHFQSGGREAVGAAPSTINRAIRSTRHTPGDPSVRPSASGRPFEEDDRVETARLCDELVRWSSALEGAERQLGGKAGSAGLGYGGPGGNGARTRRVVGVAADDAVEEGSERSTSTRENFHHERFRGDDHGGGIPTTHCDTGNEPGRFHAVHEGEARAREHGRRRSRWKAGDAKVSGGRDRSRSVEDVHDVGVDEVDVGGLEGGDSGPVSSPSRRRVGGIRKGAPGNSNGDDGPTPSYALPTKHFKAIDRGRKHLLYAEDADGQKQMQRQAHLEDENAALRLRLEGQRRAIHELEHQANTLREDARVREEELSRLKARVVRSSSLSGGKCSCCASTHRSRARATGDNGPSALKKRALAAEGRTQTLERCLSESKAKEQRSREIVASLKHSYSSAQGKITRLESELESVRRELAESRRDAKGRMKDTRKHRRQQGEKEREAESARAQAADLAAQLRKASREVKRARLEAIELRKEKARVEHESKDLTRENRMLQDRLNDGSFRSRIRERDRRILAEIRSESRSPPRRGPPKESFAGLQPAPSAEFRARVGKGGMGRRRRLGVEDASLDSTSGSEPSDGTRSRSRSPSTAARRQDEEEGAGGRLPPRNGRRVERVSGWAGGAPKNWAGRRLSTRSADDTTEDAFGDAAILRGSTLSGGSARSSTMGARYERLQAMYRRVNRRDAGTRGRAGVG